MVSSSSVFLLLLFAFVTRSSQAQTTSDPLSVLGMNKTCNGFTICRECISSAIGCRWCSDKNHEGPRCSDRDQAMPCSSGLEDPQPAVNVTEDNAFSTDYQIQPQRIDLHLPINKPVSLKLKVRPAAIFPLDVYFLMDLSLSMEDDLQRLQELANSTIKAIRDITPDSTIGFGSFVDKPTEPYIVTNLCSGCVPAYSYSHALSLTKDVQQFLDVIGSRNISTSRDNPEGSLDALYQAVLCNEIVGWRPAPTRKIVVLLTDHLPHIGGDGKISGSIKPHPNTCQLSRSPNKGYEFPPHLAVEHDYPSLSAVYSKLLENNVFVIFAIPLSGQDAPLVVDLYSTLQKEFPNRMSFAQLQRDSRDINRKLQDVYNEISSKVQLSFSAPPELKMSYQCSPLIEGRCLLLGRPEIEIEVTIELTECTSRLEGGAEVVISTNLFGEVVIPVTPVCDCQCSRKPIKDETVCNGNGDLICGTCQCYDNWFGEECECDGSGLDGSQSCPRGDSGEECSGVGYCHCGRCNCQQNIQGVLGHNYYGDACECNNFTCGLGSNGQLCSGQGSCDCGQCACDKAPSGRPYTGDTCECYPDLDRCQRTPQEAPCSEHGSCQCGRCRCELGYGGQHCQECISGSVCGRGCRVYEPCVSCMFAVAGDKVVSNNNGGECTSECRDFTVDWAADNNNTYPSESLAECLSGDQCSGIRYRVHFESQHVLVEPQPTAACLSDQARLEPWVIVIPLLIGLIILTLIILAIIKMILMYLDYREYKQFEKESSRTKFSKNENPMYVSAWQKFECPVYRAEALMNTDSKSQRISNTSTIVSDNSKSTTADKRTAVRIGGSTIFMTGLTFPSTVDQKALDEPDYDSIQDFPIDEPEGSHNVSVSYC